MEAGAFVIIPKLKDKGVRCEIEILPLVMCKDCDNKECCGQTGDDVCIVCGIDGTPHRPTWFCADGERRTE